MSDAEKQTSRMAAILVTLLIVGGAVAVAVIMTANPREAPGISLGARIRGALKQHPDGVLLQAAGVAAAPEAKAVRNVADALLEAEPTAALVVDYPNDESVFPPEFVAPTFLWHDPDEAADAWAVDIAFSDGEEPMRLLLPRAKPPSFEIDRDVLGPTNEIYQLTPYQASAQAWTPPLELWEEIKRRSVESTAVVTFVGFDTDASEGALSRGSVRISTSADPVGAPIFYRDVPLLPDPGEKGQIKPLPKGILPFVAWRMKDVSRPDSKVVLKAMPSCANCHSFTKDGGTLAMDVEGPQTDRGAYTIASIEKEMSIENDEVITWNSFEDKPEGHSTIGFLSRISPNGAYALTTVNEDLYVANFTDYKFLQVFYPTRGILAWYSKETGEMKALPGADDTRYVHCNPVWSPDGTEIVFSRAEAFDPYEDGQPLATYAGDPNEPRIRYDLYRVPFNDGKGGTPVPIEGASENGMSNTFPKISPDGKWIVYTKCKNGLLMRPDGRLWIVPFEGGEAREMRCNTPLMNSWHSFSPNGRWMVFSSKVNRPYTQMFLTHIDEDGNDTPYVLIPNATADNRAVNIPEFVNMPYEALESIRIPAVNHHLTGIEALAWQMELSLRRRPDDLQTRLTLAWLLATSPRETVRNGKHALELLEEVRTGPEGQNPSVLDALGAAYAELGRFEEAARTVEAAIAATQRAGARPPPAMRERLGLYRAGKPYREAERSIRGG